MPCHAPSRCHGEILGLPLVIHPSSARRLASLSFWPLGCSGVVVCLSVCLRVHRYRWLMGVLQKHVIDQAPFPSPLFSNNDPGQRHGVGATGEQMQREIKEVMGSWWCNKRRVVSGRPRHFVRAGEGTNASRQYERRVISRWYQEMLPPGAALWCLQRAPRTCDCTLTRSHTHSTRSHSHALTRTH